MSGSLDYNDVLRQIFNDEQVDRKRRSRVRNLKFGPYGISLSIVGEQLESSIMPTIAHAEVAADDGVPIMVTDFVEFEPTNVIKLADSFPPDVQYVNLKSGSGLMACWSSLPRMFEMFNADSNSGMMFMSRRSEMPGWEWAAPLRRILHWMTVPTSHAVVHGASLQHENVGLLLVGNSGAGKSTTTARALREGFKSAGDDMLLVDTEGPSPVVHALYDAIKVDANLARTLAPSEHIAWTDVESHGGKKFCRINELAEDALARSIRLNAILVPQVVNSTRSRIVSATATHGLRMLAPSTMNILQGGEKRTLSKLANIGRSLPTYRLELGSDPDHLFALLRKFCCDLGK